MFPTVATAIGDLGRSSKRPARFLSPAPLPIAPADPKKAHVEHPKLFTAGPGRLGR